MKTIASFTLDVARCRLLAASTLIAALLTNPVLAGVFTWTGNQSTEWNDYRNWSPQGVPPAGSDIVVNGGYADAGGQNLTMNSVTVNWSSRGP